MKVEVIILHYRFKIVERKGRLVKFLAKSARSANLYIHVKLWFSVICDGFYLRSLCHSQVADDPLFHNPQSLSIKYALNQVRLKML